jgi:hypothetical protein
MMSNEDLISKYDHLYQVMNTDKFLSMEALGGEIPFFISTYPPSQENEAAKAIEGLKKKLETKHGIQVLIINLYELAMKILDDELGEGEIFKLEEELEQDEFKEALQSILDINEVFIPAIKRKVDSSNYQLYFFNGIGQVFPFIRSHSILNNLQNIAKKAPSVFFFPGRYTGESLELFGLLKDDNYYRAFNLDNYKL